MVAGTTLQAVWRMLLPLAEGALALPPASLAHHHLAQRRAARHCLPPQAADCAAHTLRHLPHLVIQGLQALRIRFWCLAMH